MTRIPFPGGSGRIPSGPMIFEGDWPGFFARGDECAEIVASLNYVIRKQSDPTCLKVLQELRKQFESPLIEKDG